MSDTTIRPVAAADRAVWEPLWRGYLAFYEKTLPEAVTEHCWTRLVAGREIRGFLALDAGGAGLGLAQYFFHQSTQSLGGACYLGDLFVAPAARGRRIGRRLIGAVADAARAQGCSVLYWQTEEFNGTARRLYERVAKRSPFIRYQIELG
jgi:GNAT superfamily N-acetyltransferase